MCDMKNWHPSLCVCDVCCSSLSLQGFISVCQRWCISSLLVSSPNLRSQGFPPCSSSVPERRCDRPIPRCRFHQLPKRLNDFPMRICAEITGSCSSGNWTESSGSAGAIASIRTFKKENKTFINLTCFTEKKRAWYCRSLFPFIF